MNEPGFQPLRARVASADDLCIRHFHRGCPILALFARVGRGAASSAGFHGCERCGEQDLEGKVSAFLTLFTILRDTRNVVAVGKSPHFAVGWAFHLVMASHNAERGFAF